MILIQTGVPYSEEALLSGENSRSFKARRRKFFELSFLLFTRYEGRCSRFETSPLGPTLACIAIQRQLDPPRGRPDDADCRQTLALAIAGGRMEYRRRGSSSSTNVMRRRGGLLLQLLLFLACGATSERVLLWEDDFDGDRLNASVWAVNTGNGCDQG